MPELSDHDPERRFGSLYQEHYRSIQAYALRRVESRADVADVVADVFTIAWRRIAQVPPPPGDRLWLYGVARRVIAGRHRSSRRQRRLAEAIAAASGRAGSGSASGEPARQRLAAGLAQLRPADREALALVLWEGLSHAEAGQVMGCSANAVAIRVHRAKARLREALADSGATGRRDALASRVPAVRQEGN